VPISTHCTKYSFNRRGFERELQRSLTYIKRYGTEATLIYVDLDGFKAVNDAHGHAPGDALLKAVAGELTAHVRASDVVAHLVGNEFGVLAWNVGSPQTAARAGYRSASRAPDPRVRWRTARRRRQRRRRRAACRPYRRRGHRCDGRGARFEPKSPSIMATKNYDCLGP
jgi:GGDEF domain-containing protein